MHLDGQILTYANRRVAVCCLHARNHRQIMVGVMLGSCSDQRSDHGGGIFESSGRFEVFDRSFRPNKNRGFARRFTGKDVHGKADDTRICKNIPRF